ncbi:hypothetical protein C8J28_101226 [Cereibacter azotoformans]|uniref:Uncharacterized protein n=1 Tax=Cereibacter azotoformans TaxID=43057 RepID=A0A2T5KEP8_9RHOB|nr:hypothetical protein C8J28_101226 [Cereibacter azotoformans]
MARAIDVRRYDKRTRVQEDLHRFQQHIAACLVPRIRQRPTVLMDAGLAGSGERRAHVSGLNQRLQQEEVLPINLHTGGPAVISDLHQNR